MNIKRDLLRSLAKLTKHIRSESDSTVSRQGDDVIEHCPGEASRPLPPELRRRVSIGSHNRIQPFRRGNGIVGSRPPESDPVVGSINFKQSGSEGPSIGPKLSNGISRGRPVEPLRPRTQPQIRPSSEPSRRPFDSSQGNGTTVRRPLDSDPDIRPANVRQSHSESGIFTSKPSDDTATRRPVAHQQPLDKPRPWSRINQVRQISSFSQGNGTTIHRPSDSDEDAPILDIIPTQSEED